MRRVEEGNGKPGIEDRVDWYFNSLGQNGKDPFVNAVLENENPDLDVLDRSANLVKGAGKLIEILEDSSDDEDFVGIGIAKVLIALEEQLAITREKK